MNRARAAAWLIIGAIVLPRAGEAGQGAPASPTPTAPTASAGIPFAGPPPPVPPDVIARDGAGHATIRATRLTSPLRVDGQLDEAVYVSVPPMSDFIQNDPQEGARSTEKTEIWFLFDSKNVYIVARCSETHPERMVANEMRRDNANVAFNDSIAFGFDSFYDRRSAVFFEANSIGGRIDGQMTNERQTNLDWNPVWEVKTGRFDGGWTMEAAIPFKSLRYRPGRALGVQRAPRQSLEERGVVPHAYSGVDDDARALSAIADGHGCGVGCAGGVEEPGDQAVRDLQSHDRCQRKSEGFKRSRRRCRG